MLVAFEEIVRAGARQCRKGLAGQRRRNRERLKGIHWPPGNRAFHDGSRSYSCHVTRFVGAVDAAAAARTAGS